MARGLDYAHNYGGLNLVHRDIAPPNVILSWHGEVKVTDFGLARSILKNERTAPGIVYGRVAYLAPEQARGEQADPRTDVYAAGIILWELLTGRPLHDTGDDAVKNLEKARHPRIEPPSHLTRGLPTSLDNVVQRALAPDRQNRFRTAEEFRKALADELGRIAPTTDASRVSTFLRDLFPDEIKSESQERERLLREELPLAREEHSRVGPNPAIRSDATENEPPTRQHRSPTNPSLPPIMLGDETKTRTPNPRKPAPPPIPAPPRRTPPKVPTVPPLQGADEARRPARSLVQKAMARSAGIDDSQEEELTRMRSPRRDSGAPTRGAVPARKALADLDSEEEHLDPDREPELANLEGEVLDARYRVLRLLGTGGMGAVYEAEHIEIGKKVALKVLHPQYSRQADLVARFRREARAASKVGHPNIVDVTDSGTTDGGDVYFVMERLDGLDLGEVLRHERRIAPDRTVLIGTQICRALSAAHAAGIIHRDLKPENVFLVSRDGIPDFVKVLDFGIAKQDMGNQNLPRRLTTPGMAMGTPEYMAPEQAAGKAIDGRVDIYSVGAILYEMLTGEPPHHGDNAMEVLTKKATEPPRPIRELNPEVADPLETVVLSCLERDPDKRPQTMGALEYELNKSMKGRGSAVAAVLGIKDTSGDPTATWMEDSKVRRFDSPDSKVRRRPSSPALSTPPPVTGATGAVPLETQDGNVRVRSGRVASRDAIAPTVPFDADRGGEKRLKKKSSAGMWIAVVVVLLLAGGGYAAWRMMMEKVEPQKPDPVAVTPPPKPVKPEVPIEAPKPAAPKQADPEKLKALLEWARRTVEGGRIIAPPGDNLKELLERIEKEDPGNTDAAALRQRTVGILARKGSLALKRDRVDEAVQDFEGLAALAPDDPKVRAAYARARRLRAERLLERHRLQAAFNDINASLELDPDNTFARVVLADILLAQGKPQEAADEYQRILDGKPADKRARRGLLMANAAKAKPAPKKKKGGK
jgi:serine/threonine protein kinase